MKKLLIAVLSIAAAGSPHLIRGSVQEGVKVSKAAKKALGNWKKGSVPWP